MPLEILAVYVVGGISLVILLVKIFVNTEPRLLTNEAIVRKVFKMDFPGWKIKQIIIGSKQEKAVLFLNDKEMGLVEIMGSKWLTRVLNAENITRFEHKLDKTILLTLKEFTLPYVEIEFSSEQEAAKVFAFLEEVTNVGSH